MLVILGGNGVSSEMSIPNVSQKMRVFHDWLRLACPNAVIIASESEPWYDKNPNECGEMVSESHWVRRNAFNHAVGRLLARRRCDYVLRTARYLNHREFYGRSGVHLNDRGNRFYWGLVKETLMGALLKYPMVRN